jgi:hypothetical protein
MIDFLRRSILAVGESYAILFRALGLAPHCWEM